MRIIVVVTAVAFSIGSWACKRERSSPEPPVVVVEPTPGLPIGRKPSTSRALRSAQNAVSKQAPRRTSANPLEWVAGDSYEGWITPAISKEFWRPSPQQIASMEAVMTTVAADGMARAKLSKHIDLRTYTRQYRGFYRDGLDFIEIRFFCEQSKHLARGPIQIQGGGSCFLQTIYDVQKQRFLEWHKNSD